jgi:hypothetical protein
MANSLTTRSGAKKVVLFLSQGYPTTMYTPGDPSKNIDYFNPIVYAGSQAAAKTLINNNWSIYNVAFYNTVHPCVAQKPARDDNNGYATKDWTASNQCYISTTTTYSTTTTNHGRNSQFYNSSISGSFPVGSSSVPSTWMKPFDAFVSTQQQYAQSKASVDIASYYLSGDNLGDIFTSISQQLTTTYIYSPVTVKQKLSRYVAPVDVTAVGGGVSAKVVNADGSAATFGGATIATVYDSVSQTLTVTIPQLGVGQKFTATYDVMPTQAAYAKYVADGDYPDVGDDTTGSLSEDKDGFFIDDSADTTGVGANLTYAVTRLGMNPESVTEQTTYKRPVIQVTPTATIPVEKQWGPDPIDTDPSKPLYALDNLPNVPNSVTLHLLKDGVDTGKTLTLGASNSWKGHFDEVDLGHVYTLKEDGVQDSAGSALYEPCFISRDLATPAASECSVTQHLQQSIDLTSAMTTKGWLVRNMAVQSQVSVVFKVKNGTFTGGVTSYTQQVFALAGRGTLQQAAVDRALDQITADKGYALSTGTWDVTPDTTRGGLIQGNSYVYTFTLNPTPVSQLPLTGGTGSGWTRIVGPLAVAAVFIFAIAAKLRDRARRA